MPKNIDVVKLLLDYSKDKLINLNAKSRTCRRTAFMLVCYDGDIDFVKLLLDYSEDWNIDLNAMDIYGTTAFMIACDGGRKDVVKLLLDHSEDRKIVLNARDEHGRTALVRACMKGNKDVVKLLLDHSEDRNIVFQMGTLSYNCTFKQTTKNLIIFAFEEIKLNQIVTLSIKLVFPPIFSKPLDVLVNGSTYLSVRHRAIN